MGCRGAADAVLKICNLSLAYLHFPWSDGNDIFKDMFKTTVSHKAVRKATATKLIQDTAIETLVVNPSPSWLNT